MKKPTNVEDELDVLIVAIPETAGSALYGMLDVLKSVGNIWQALVRSPPLQKGFRVNVVSTGAEPFHCGHGIPVEPAYSIENAPWASIIIVPELWLGPDESIQGRYPGLMSWLRDQYRQGAYLYSACSGAIFLAETGLLNGCHVTSHWGYQDLFRDQYPSIRFHPEPNLVYADPVGRIVTAGGTTSWHDLAIHIIARHFSPGEALRMAKVYLLKMHEEGQLPYGSLVRRAPHADAVVKACEEHLGHHFREIDALKQVVAGAAIPERTLKRRFKSATGMTLIEYVQNLRIEEAKRLLESSHQSIEDISAGVGYEDASFFRRLFKRLAGLTPGQYRKMFQSVLQTMPE